MESITTDLAGLLEGIQRPGDFYTCGTYEIFAPGLEVQGVGPIALPLLPARAKELIAAAERAPYGRGEQTLVDIEVRRTWQIGSDRVQVHGRAWARTLDALVARVAEGLGVSGPVTAELYKLLVYDEGGFFANHRDSEKTAGMFATLIIVLPSIYTGGELVIRHQGREVRIDLRSLEPSEAGFVAFYADCVHEVLPVASGCRLTLVYNLSRKGRDGQPRPPSYARERDSLTALLRQWNESSGEGGEDSPVKLIYPLEHAYTAASLSFEALKGADAAKVATLLPAAKEAGCDLYLALVSIEESGSAEYAGSYRDYGRGGKGERFEVIDVDERSETLSDWRQPDGGDVKLGVLPVADGEVSPPDAFDDLVPDEQSFHEATGNEGASFERSYRRTAVVLWPSRRRLAVFNQGGLSVTLPYLTNLTEQWVASGEDRRSPLWIEAHELSGHMLSSWPMRGWRHAKQPTDASAMLTLLSRLEDTERIDAFLARVLAGGVFDKGDSQSVMLAIRLLPPPRASELLQRIVAGNAEAALGACGELLMGAAAFGAFDLVPAATSLVAALPGDPARTAAVAPWKRPPAMDAGIVADILMALDRIDSALAGAAVDIFLGWPNTYDPDAVLIPTVLALDQLTTSNAVSSPATVERLRAACRAHLGIRIAEPLVPPRDWTRDATLSCRCKYCGELRAFLADPALQTWSFKSLQGNRSHVEQTIRNSGCDLNTETVRRGSPHSLVCTKNQASYDRRARQRRKDLKDLAGLEEHEAEIG